ncbi:hypothetical protein E2562_019601 [Oryza meyeriana var. granulata]|uniref:Uncharacterized protein n=1 Tax=Oryza meyeriana var. granulata TaxID=110450 RepID=A0A6G1EXG7_9ORYZ|nr:hypothetical protein E2562_019601 [Oryza meyeriana var. granulata]
MAQGRQQPIADRRVASILILKAQAITYSLLPMTRVAFFSSSTTIYHLPLINSHKTKSQFTSSFA